VYWAREGRRSVDAAIGLIAVGGIYLAGAPFWHRAAQECVRTSVDTASGRILAQRSDDPSWLRTTGLRHRR
jgi:hypothetical protein